MSHLVDNMQCDLHYKHSELNGEFIQGSCGVIMVLLPT